MTETFEKPVRDLHERLRGRGETLATAESCTGGMLGEAITAVPGSSDVYEGGVISYSNRLKRELLGVSEPLLRDHGAVSEPVARNMAEGVCERLHVSVSLSITGVAGPGGGSPDKPVGLVFVGCRGGETTRVQRHEFEGDRHSVRQKSVSASLELVNEVLR